MRRGYRASGGGLSALGCSAASMAVACGRQARYLKCSARHCMQSFFMTDLKLIALGPEDLQIVSAHLQDAVLTVADIAYLPREKRFAALLNRFDWAAAQSNPDVSMHDGAKPSFARRRAALRFEQVTAARLKGIDLADKKRVLNLLAIQFEPRGEGDPAGAVSLIFAADAAIRLDVEYIEAEMRDLGAVWATSSRPEHTET